MVLIWDSSFPAAADAAGDPGFLDPALPALPATALAAPGTANADSSPQALCLSLLGKIQLSLTSGILRTCGGEWGGSGHTILSLYVGVPNFIAGASFVMPLNSK